MTRLALGPRSWWYGVRDSIGSGWLGVGFGEVSAVSP